MNCYAQQIGTVLRRPVESGQAVLITGAPSPRCGRLTLHPRARPHNSEVGERGRVWRLPQRARVRRLRSSRPGGSNIADVNERARPCNATGAER